MADYENSLTPLDVAANDRTRELLIVYSANVASPKKEDLEWMDKAVLGY